MTDQKIKNTFSDFSTGSCRGKYYKSVSEIVDTIDYTMRELGLEYNPSYNLQLHGESGVDMVYLGEWTIRLQWYRMSLTGNYEVLFQAFRE